MFLLLGILSVWMLFFKSVAWSEQNSLELHSGTVKIVRSGKSHILQKAGETYLLSANDRLQTGENTQVTLYLNDRDNVVKLFSHSFLKLDDISEKENNVALFTGKANFSVKPLTGASGAGEDDSQIGKKEESTASKFKAKLGGDLKGGLTKLGKSKLSRKKKRFKVRTVSAVIGVRGTKFVLATGSFSPNRADLLVLPEKEPGTKSEATLANTKLSEYEEKVGPGEISRVVENRGPSVSVTISPEEIARIAEGDGPDSFKGVEFGLSESIDSIKERQRREDDTPRFDEATDSEGEFLEQLDRLEELETVVRNAENAIDSTKSKFLILSMTFTNR